MESTIIASIIGLLGTIAAALITARTKDKNFERTNRQQKLQLSKSNKDDYGIKIIAPVNGEKVDNTILIRGIYNELPTSSSLQVFTISQDRQYRPQQGARVIVDRNAKEWHASLSTTSIEMQKGQNKTIGVALIGEAGDALCQYFWKAGRLAKQYPGIDKLTPDIIFYGEVVVIKA